MNWNTVRVNVRVMASFIGGVAVVFGCLTAMATLYHSGGSAVALPDYLGIKSMFFGPIAAFCAAFSWLAKFIIVE
jgi:hypothetical protein